MSLGLGFGFGYREFGFGLEIRDWGGPFVEPRRRGGRRFGLEGIGRVRVMVG